MPSLHSDRAFMHITDVTNLTPGLRFDTDITSVSDSNYFENFGAGADQTSVTFLERRAELLYYDDAWRIRAQLQNFQTIDTSIDAGDRPYSRVPRVEAYGPLAAVQQQIRISRLSSEVTNFLREVGPAGVRMDLSPEIRWSDAQRRLFLRTRRRISLHPIRFAECRLRRSEHAHPHRAVRAGSTPD